MKYWHLAIAPMELGAQLRARTSDGHYAFLNLTLGGKTMTVEDFLESARPKKFASRKQCFFMCETQEDLYHSSPGPADTLVHLVEFEPVMPRRHHFGWIATINDVAASMTYGEVKTLDPEQEETLRMCAELYWGGEDVPDDLERAHNTAWEFLARDIHVLDCAGPFPKGCFNMPGMR